MGKVMRAGPARQSPARQSPPRLATAASARARTTRAGSVARAGLAFSAAACLALFLGATPTGCARTRTSTASVEMPAPRASGGILVDEPDDEGMARISQALDALGEPAVSPAVLAALRESELKPLPMPARAGADGGDDAPTDAEPAPAVVASDAGGITPLLIPPGAGRLLTLKKLGRSELDDLVSSIRLRLRAESGYRPAPPDRAALLGGLPPGVVAGPVLSREQADGSTALISLGSLWYASQLPQLWARGVVVDAAGVVTPNPDLDTLQAQADATLAQIEQMRAGLTHADLERQIIQLSYTGTAGALNALKGMGVATTPAIEQLPATIDFSQLPMVTIMPAPAPGETGLIGETSLTRGEFGVTVSNNATQLSPEVNAAPASQLLVLFHPAHPEQLSMVQSLLDEYIDRPARLVFVEGMVLEISEEGLEELGIEWQFKEGPTSLILGSLNPGVLAESLIFNQIDSVDVPQDWSLKIRALVREGKAEILSRPSVLTINNRQATIRVGEDIPVATSTEGTAFNSNKTAFNFRYIPTGILLNIRPRISEDGDEVSMLVDTVVSAQVPGRDLEIRSSEGELLASAPTISTRRVQTYARIDNKTPFIIGGLVSRDRTIVQDKVPLLGDLPIIGAAFRSERTSSLKREVIIVLTPYVLPEDQAVSRALPQDNDLFDITGNELFRDAYRIRSGDVFDLRFIAENKRLKTYRNLARQVIAENFRMAEVAPFSAFARSRIPGEEILVQRMIYEVIKRTGVDDRVNPERIILFEAEDTQGYRVQFLNRVLASLGDGVEARSFFERDTGKALAITFHYDRDSMEPRRMASEPIPEIALVDCPDRDAWRTLLWDMNQPDADGIRRFTILLHDPSDIERLRRAVMMKAIILLNSDNRGLNLTNFSVGKVLHVPAMEEDKVSVLDSEVARCFFTSELYYAAIIRRVEETINHLDRALQDPEIRGYLDDPSQIPTPVQAD